MLSSDSLNAAAAEFKSYVIAKRRHHEDATCAASEILDDVEQFLLRDFAFQSRTHVFRLFKLCCLVVGMPNSNLPAVTIDLGGERTESGDGSGLYIDGAVSHHRSEFQSSVILLSVVTCCSSVSYCGVRRFLQSCRFQFVEGSLL